MKPTRLRGHLERLATYPTWQQELGDALYELDTAETPCEIPTKDELLSAIDQHAIAPHKDHP